MGWIPVSSHGIDPRGAADPLQDVLAMAAWGNSLYAAAYRPGSGREAELWKAPIGDEDWTLVARISGVLRPQTMVLHNRALYVGGAGGAIGSAKLVRISADHTMTDVALPVPGAPNVTSLLSKGPYLLVTLDGVPDKIYASIWRTTIPESFDAWEQIAREITADRPHVYSITLGMGLAGEILAGTGRATPGGPGSPGQGAEVWQSTNDGSSWDRLADDGFGDPANGAVPALHSFRNVWGGVHIFASAQNHTAGSTVYKSYSGSRRWESVPYHPGGVWDDVAPIRSMAIFENRLFIGEGNRAIGARLFYTISGNGWTEDGYLLRTFGFSGAGGEPPLALHALTPANASRQRFLYMAVQYTGAGVRIWRRTPNTWDSFVRGILSIISRVFRSLRVVTPSPWRWPPIPPGG